MKKRPDLKTTLTKKVALPKSVKSIKEVDKGLEALHSSGAKPVVDKHEESVVKTSLWLPKSLHRRIKIHCAGTDDMSLRKFMIEAIEEKLRHLEG